MQTAIIHILLVFEALLDERHVSRVAARVGLSQPAMSNSLARLRVFFKDPLFVRSGTGMRATRRAEQFSTAVRAALSTLRDALEAPRHFDPALSTRRFRVGLTDDLALRVAGELARSPVEIGASGHVGSTVCFWSRTQRFAREHSISPADTSQTTGMSPPTS